ncbi:MAG: glycosyltransferase family 4 protein [Anaerolineales bacterium]
MTSLQKESNYWLALSWAPYSRMSQTFARELGGKLHCIHYLRFQSPPHAPFKYILQAIRTLVVLFRERPRAVHVQTPPFVAGLVVDLYCRLSGAKFVLHYHSAAFERIWDWALPFQKYIARRATTNIVTNSHWAGIVNAWGGHTLVMVDPYLDLPESKPFSVKPGFNVAFVSTFAQDEPLDAVLEAAAMLPDVNFYITGDKRKKPASFFENAPANVTFTGFLDPDKQYPGLLRAVDTVMVLTTRNYTLQLGGCEATAVGKPLVTSDWPYLREVFPKGTVYVTDTAKSIQAGILQLKQDYDRLSEEIVVLREESQQEWNSRLTQLNRLMGGGAA